MNRAGSEHRNATAAPKSSGSPTCPTGTVAPAVLRSPPWSRLRRSVACRPGCTELTVTPCGATSVASVFRNPVTPARAVLDRMSEAAGWRTVIDVMATTRPQPRPTMAGTAARHMATVDIRFSSRAGR
jgi:hypothetical protein